jgi:hypothetical protein
MPSKKVRARQRNAAKADTPTVVPNVPAVPNGGVTLRQLARAHDRGVRRGFRRQDTYGEMGEGALIIGWTEADVQAEIRAELGPLPKGSEGRISYPSNRVGVAHGPTQLQVAETQ